MLCLVMIEILLFCVIVVLYFVYVNTRIKVWALVGYIFYGAGLTLLRGVKPFFRKKRHVEYSIRERAPSVSKLIQYHTLADTQVVLGYDRATPVKVDIMKGHTLIGASSGFGKTMLIHSILVQLFQKPNFDTDVYVIDLKAVYDEANYLPWRNVFRGYATIGDNGSITDAIALIERVIREARQENSKRILLIIDEFPTLLQSRVSRNLFTVVASQLRTKGSLILTAQSPTREMIPTAIKNNITRRICGGVISKTQARVVLEASPNEIPSKAGDFIVRDYGSNRLRSIYSLMVDYPSEIEQLVTKVLETRHEEDDRVRLFKIAAQGLLVGESLPGVRKLTDFPTKWVTDTYREFAELGLIEQPTQGKPYVLKVPFDKALKKIPL